MSYQYEVIDPSTDTEYLDCIDNIETLRNNLKINDRKLLDLMERDICDNIQIEGNQLSRMEVTSFLSNDVTIRGESFRDFSQAHNYSHVLDAMRQTFYDKDFVLTEETICMIHQMITEGELEPSSCGIYRHEPVHINTTDYIPPNEFEVPFYMSELLEKYYRPLEYGETQFERICEFKRNFERIHPFADGNGRTGRMLMNTLFLQNSYGFLHIPASERDLYFDSLDNNTFHVYAAPKMLEIMEEIQDKHKSYNIAERTADDFER